MNQTNARAATMTCYGASIPKSGRIWRGTMLLSLLLPFANLTLAILLVADITAAHDQGNPGPLTVKEVLAYLQQNPPYPLIALMLASTAALFFLRKEYIEPAHDLLAHANAMVPADDKKLKQRLSFRRAASDFAAMIRHATHLSAEHQTLKEQLTGAQTRIEEMLTTQRKLHSGAYGETLHVFHTVQGYANYLEDMVLARRTDESVRYDYDEVCEATHNLQFLMQGMVLMLQKDTHPQPLPSSPCDLGEMLSRFLIQVMPALERRAMSVSSERFPAKLCVIGHEPILKPLLWAILYAGLRHAQDGSTLRIEGKAGEERATLRFFLHPSGLSGNETQEPAVHAANALTNAEQCIHSFAQGLAQHPNLQMAAGLAALIGGTVDCLPQGPYSCAIELTLPARQ